MPDELAENPIVARRRRLASCSSKGLGWGSPFLSFGLKFAVSHSFKCQLLPPTSRIDYRSYKVCSFWRSLSRQQPWEED